MGSLARQLCAEGALDLGDELAVRDRLPVLVRVDDLRLLVDRLRQLRLRHALRRPRLHDRLAEAQADLLVCGGGGGLLELGRGAGRLARCAQEDLRDSSSVSRSSLARFWPSTPLPELLPAVTEGGARAAIGKSGEKEIKVRRLAGKLLKEASGVEVGFKLNCTYTSSRWRRQLCQAPLSCPSAPSA